MDDKESYQVSYTVTALRQLLDIEKFISDAGEPNRAQSYTARIRKLCETLTTFPRRFAKRGDT